MKHLVTAFTIGIALFFGVMMFSSKECIQETIDVPTCVTDLDESIMSRKELGLYGWSLLHSMAAYFPSTPTSAHITHAKSFLLFFAELYPCRQCGKHLDIMLQESPPDFSSRDQFVIYLCNLHNQVNAKLGKTLQDCSIDELNKKWGGGGDCGCEAANVFG